MEQVVDSRSTDALNSDIFHESTLYHFPIGVKILVNKHEYHLWLILISADIL